MSLLIYLGLGCTSVRLPVSEAESGIGLAGKELVYRFPTGRIYRAAYTEGAVSFALLEPRLDVQPSATMPYVWHEIRRDVYLVVWDSDAFHTTFVVDLERRKLHASARRNGSDRFIGTAEIVSVFSIGDAGD